MPLASSSIVVGPTKTTSAPSQTAPNSTICAALDAASTRSISNQYRIERTSIAVRLALL